jgi:hypothetical protein
LTAGFSLSGRSIGNIGLGATHSRSGRMSRTGDQPGLAQGDDIQDISDRQ